MYYIESTRQLWAVSVHKNINYDTAKKIDKQSHLATSEVDYCIA